MLFGHQAGPQAVDAAESSRQVVSVCAADGGPSEIVEDPGLRPEYVATPEYPCETTVGLTQCQVVLVRFVGGWIGLLTPRAHGLPDWR